MKLPDPPFERHSRPTASPRTTCASSCAVIRFGPACWPAPITMSVPTVYAAAPSRDADWAAAGLACTRTFPRSAPKRDSKNALVPESSPPEGAARAAARCPPGTAMRMTARASACAADSSGWLCAITSGGVAAPAMSRGNASPRDRDGATGRGHCGRDGTDLGVVSESPCTGTWLKSAPGRDAIRPLAAESSIWPGGRSAAGTWLGRSLATAWLAGVRFRLGNRVCSVAKLLRGIVVWAASTVCRGWRGRWPAMEAPIATSGDVRARSQIYCPTSSCAAPAPQFSR